MTRRMPIEGTNGFFARVYGTPLSHAFGQISSFWRGGWRRASCRLQAEALLGRRQAKIRTRVFRVPAAAGSSAARSFAGTAVKTTRPTSGAFRATYGAFDRGLRRRESCIEGLHAGHVEAPLVSEPPGVCKKAAEEAIDPTQRTHAGDVRAAKEKGRPPQPPSNEASEAAARAELPGGELAQLAGNLGGDGLAGMDDPVAARVLLQTEHAGADRAGEEAGRDRRIDDQCRHDDAVGARRRAAPSAPRRS